MDLNIGREVTALQRLSLPELRTRYAEAFGEAPHTPNRTWLIKRIAWRLQALAEGDLSERAKRRAAELANDADLRTIAPREKAGAAPVATFAAPQTRTVATPTDRRLPLPGTILTRPYKGQLLQVQVLADGFAYAGQVYRSLSAVAKAITGGHCNGFLFFRDTLNTTGGDR